MLIRKYEIEDKFYSN